MRIGFVFDDTLDAPDGVQQHIMTLGRELVRRGHQVVYFVGETKTHPVGGIVPLSRNVAVPFNGNVMRIPLPASRRRIRTALEHYHCDVLHVQAPYSPFLAGRVISLAKEVTPHARIVATYHIVPYSKAAEVGGRVLAAVNAFSGRKIDQVIAVSPVAAAYAQKTAGCTPLVIPNPVDCRAMEAGGFSSDRFSDRRDGKHLVFLGRFVERKGVRLLMNALEYGATHGIFPSGMHVTCAGKGPDLETCQRQAEQIDLPIDFPGFVDEKDKPALLASADIAVFPSISGESFGIVLVEAIAAGAGVVLAGDNPGYRSTVGDNEQALFDVSPDQGTTRSAALLAERIALMMTDSRLAACVHKQEQALIPRYDVRHVVDQLVDVYTGKDTERPN